MVTLKVRGILLKYLVIQNKFNVAMLNQIQKHV